MEGGTPVFGPWEQNRNGHAAGTPEGLWFCGCFFGLRKHSKALSFNCLVDVASWVKDNVTKRTQLGLNFTKIGYLDKKDRHFPNTSYYFTESYMLSIFFLK